MEGLYRPTTRKEEEKKHGGILQYCWDCFNNPISWLVAPTLIGYAHIITGAMSTGEGLREIFTNGQLTYQDMAYRTVQTVAEKILNPESFAGLTGFLFGGKVWRFVRHR